MKVWWRLAIVVALGATGTLVAQDVGGFYDLEDYKLFPECSQNNLGSCEDPEEKKTSPTPTPSPTQSRQVEQSQRQQNPAAQQAIFDDLQDMTFEDAPILGRDLAREMREQAANGVTQATAEQVPGYNEGRGLQQFADDPEALENAGAIAASGNEAFLVANNPFRPTFNQDRDALSRALEIESDPHRFLTGVSLDGGNGRCQPLPPGEGGTEYYEATCHEGVVPGQSSATCLIPRVVEAERRELHAYKCAETYFPRNNLAVCRPELLTSPFCHQDSFEWVDVCLQGTINNCSEADQTQLLTFHCTQPIPQQPRRYSVFETRITDDYWDETQCQGLSANGSCDVEEICTDINPRTRDINGVNVTKDCWAKQRSYTCDTSSQASDCDAFDSNPSCRPTGESCLDDPQEGACVIRERYFQCPLPGQGEPGPAEYICDGDIYCINGNCEEIERTPSEDFGDAIVALNALGQASGEFNEQTLTLFSGERETCSKKLFGAINCCSGKGVPLLTPFLCSAQDREVDRKDDAGLCHKVGSYCSRKVLGVCVAKKRAYCCYESKLTRIIQQQGRPQLGIEWDKPKEEQCEGFTIHEFQQLDLSLMDFSEIYADFTDAVRLPDEIEASQQIQDRLQEYYNNRPGP